MRLLPRSVTLRVITFSTVWAIAALIVIATVISALYSQASSRNFNRLLDAHLFNLIGAVTVDEQGNLIGAPDFGDLRYTEPGSGWYWSVELLGDAKSEPIHSESLSSPIPARSPVEVPFDRNFRRSYVAEGIGGEKVRILESEYLLGTSDRVVRSRIMGNESEFQEDIAAFRRFLFTYLGLFGLGMIAINAAAIVLGLRPLDRVRKALGQIREGRVHRLDGEFPSEIAPLTDEMNALIENNRRIVERARTQVGNLAHSLKTPLAVLVNEADIIGGKRGTLIAEQADAMRTQIEHYLQRARIAAQRDSIVYRTDVDSALVRMVRVVAKLNKDKKLSYVQQARGVVFAGEQQDFEEIVGNLLENAMKWAKSRVDIRIDRQGSEHFSLEIGDDGPGIPPEMARDALKRGSRLDETKPGTGLGLAIVSELVSEYGGTLELERSGLGGLAVKIVLPAAIGA